MTQEPIPQRGPAAVAVVHLWDLLQVDQLSHLFQEISAADHYLRPRVRVNEGCHELHEVGRQASKQVGRQASKQVSK